MIREWSSARDPETGMIRCVVQDVPTAVVGHETTDGRRPWRWHVVDSLPAPDSETGDGEPWCPCVPGRPCPKCQIQAIEWWGTHDQRSAERFWVAARDRTRGEDPFCRHQHKDRPGAERCRKRLGWARVECRDGHWRLIETSAGEQASLLPVKP